MPLLPSLMSLAVALDSAGLPEAASVLRAWCAWHADPFDAPHLSQEQVWRRMWREALGMARAARRCGLDRERRAYVLAAMVARAQTSLCPVRWLLALTEPGDEHVVRVEGELWAIGNAGGGWVEVRPAAQAWPRTLVEARDWSQHGPTLAGVVALAKRLADPGYHERVLWQVCAALDAGVILMTPTHTVGPYPNADEEPQWICFADPGGRIVEAVEEYETGLFRRLGDRAYYAGTRAHVEPDVSAFGAGRAFVAAVGPIAAEEALRRARERAWAGDREQAPATVRKPRATATTLPDALEAAPPAD